MSGRNVSVLFEADLRPFIKAMDRIAATLAQLHWSPAGGLRKVDRHHPWPLPINGRVYHQRQRNRRRSR